MINRVLDLFTRLLMFWVIAAAAIGYYWPPVLTVFRPGLPWFFALTMVGIGAVLSPRDFEPLVKKPHLVLLGTLAQFAIMPLLGFLIAWALALPPDLALGVILVGAVPGAMASNVISYVAKADVAYSVALTSTTTFLAPILTPAFTFLFGHVYLHINVWSMFFDILKLVILPMLLGMGLKMLFPAPMGRATKAFPALSTLCIAFICGLVVALNADKLASITILIFVAVALHNALGLLLGYLAAVLFRFDARRRRTVAFEVGMQNAGLGAVLALNQFSAQAALPNALFASWCIITASILALIWSRIPPEKA